MAVPSWFAQDGAALTAMAAPAEPADCLGFRITSPTKSGLEWTYGQCYSVDWDLGASKVNKITKVELVNAKTNKSVYTEIKNVDGKKLTTGNFVLLTGDDVTAGKYYFQVTASTTSKKTCTLKTVAFNLLVNPNSPPEDSCPN
ncbi:hypothetical protein BC940DRAFT_336969 [Gongronella butleri]|nr:hypothetical protein BC940DRAFT_336969 [Gongronella butleri]